MRLTDLKVDSYPFRPPRCNLYNIFYNSFYVILEYNKLLFDVQLVSGLMKFSQVKTVLVTLSKIGAFNGLEAVLFP